MENGYLERGLDVKDFFFKIEHPAKNTVYKSVKQYVDSNIILSDLNYEKIRPFFYLYIFFFLFYIIIYTIKILIYFLQKRKWKLKIINSFNL